LRTVECRRYTPTSPFHWELEFPDVFREPGAGFDAVVGNPPWEIQKPSSKEFFSDRDPLYRSYGKQEALTRQRELFQNDARIERDWLDYVSLFKDRGNFVRYAAEPFGDTEDATGKPEVALVARRAAETKQLHRKWAAERKKRSRLSDPEHPFRFQGSADLNTYKMFVEAGHALLRAGGQLGMIAPSGLYTDKGSAELRRLLLERCRWRWLYGFEDRNKLFDIHRSFKFCVTIAEKGGATEAIQAAFMRHDLEDWAEARGALAYPRERLRTTGLGIDAFFEVGGSTDLEVLGRVFASSAAVSSLTTDGCVFTREIDKTNDSKKLHPRSDLTAWGLDVEGRDFRRPVDRAFLLAEGWVPVWEGKCCRFDEWIAEPSLFARAAEVLAYLRGGFPFGFRRIARNTDVRTLIGCIVPPMVPTTYTVEVARDLETEGSMGLYGVMSSFVLDWVMRFQVSSSVALFNLHALPLPAHPWISTRSTLSRVVRRLLQETDSGKRRSARFAIDALVAEAYGLSGEELRWILRDCDHPRARLADKAFCRRLDPKGFWRVDKDQDPELRHSVLSLAAFDDLAAAIAAAGDRDAGIQAFCDQHDGDGWMLPETLCLADLRATRTIDAGAYDDRARTPQPVASRLGERFLDWQLAQTPEESWAECERHARALLGGMMPATAAEETGSAAPAKGQQPLFGPDPGHRP
jgi:hypothetical protein